MKSPLWLFVWGTLFGAWAMIGVVHCAERPTSHSPPIAETENPPQGAEYNRGPDLWPLASPNRNGDDLTITFGGPVRFHDARSADR